MFHPAWVFDADAGASEVATSLPRRPALPWAVIRLRQGERLYFHLFTAAELTHLLSVAGAGASLLRALALEGRAPAPLLSADASRTLGPRDAPTVLLDAWLQVAGVLLPPRGQERSDAVPARAPDPPQTVYPALGAPDTVAAWERFVLEAGLAPNASAASPGDVLLPFRPDERWLDLDVQVVADGFRAPAGWRHTLRVWADDPFAARVSMPLVALGGENEVRLTLVVVHFSCRGAPCGVASRRIVVRPDPMPSDSAAPPGGVQWTTVSRLLPAPLRGAVTTPPDLTLRIDKPDGRQGGRYMWTYDSPHPVPLLGEPVAMDLGEDSASFAGVLIRGVSEYGHGPTADGELRGLGQRIADKIPPAVWNALRAVHARVQAGDPDRVPTVLLLTAEPHVPWELACIDEPFDPTRPPFLGAQVAVGRWVVTPREPLPRMQRLDVRRMAVVAVAGGDRPLPAAEKESAELRRRYGAFGVPATASGVDHLLNGSGAPPAAVQVIHFACHGQVGATNPRQASLLLGDSTRLSPAVFRSARVARSHAPLLFLNACEVGNAGELLGEYAGFAGEALRAGFSGFVAPLWPVTDAEARHVALEFYERAFSGTPISLILRDIRAHYGGQGASPDETTFLSYVFYGDPSLLFAEAPGSDPPPVPEQFSRDGREHSPASAGLTPRNQRSERRSGHHSAECD